MEVQGCQEEIKKVQSSLEEAREVHQSLLASKEDPSGDMEVEVATADLLEKVTKGIRPELLQSQEAVQALQTLQQVILENQKAEEASKDEKVFKQDDKDSPSEDEETDRLWESLLKLQSKKVEQPASEAVPEGGDAAAMAALDIGFSKSLEKSLAAKTSKSHRFQPYSG